MTQDGKGTGYSYSFDAENRLAKATGMTGGPYCYVYDGFGLRVAKKSGANSDCTGGTVTKLYWRSVSGDALAETDGSGSTANAAYTEYVFFAGRRVASRNGSGGIFYWFADQLGSTRTITTGSGTGQTPGQLCYDADFTPYGQEISYTARLQTTACPPSYKFTGYERDPETAYGATDTGLDYAFARYYSSRLGRFLSTDPLGGSVGDLQSHNAYAYVENNPANFIDPIGLDDCKVTNGPAAVGTVIRCNVSAPADLAEIHLTDVPGICTMVYRNGFLVSSSNGCSPNPVGGRAGVERVDGRSGGGGGNTSDAANKTCGGGPSNQTTTIVSGNVTTSALTTWLGGLLGGLIGGPAGAAVGGTGGSLVGVGATVSWVPSTNSWYVGPTVVVGIVPGGGSGASLTAVTVPPTQNPNSVANHLSFSLTWQPFWSAGATVTKSPGSGPAVAGFSTGTRIPASGGASVTICVHNCGC